MRLEKVFYSSIPEKDSSWFILHPSEFLAGVRNGLLLFLLLPHLVSPRPGSGPMSRSKSPLPGLNSDETEGDREEIKREKRGERSREDKAKQWETRYVEMRR